MRIVRTFLVAALLTALPTAALAAPAPSRAPGVRAVVVEGDLQKPTGFTFAPDGRIWYIEKDSGEIRILSPGTGRDRLFFDVPDVEPSGERGGLGVALHPRWPDKPFVYAYVTRTGTGGDLQNQLLRIRAEGRDPAGWKVLLKWNVSTATNHNGGRIVFGPDGNLWIVTGENANPAFSQQRANLRGKVLRVRPDGSIPADNPFGTRVWAYGIRNSFGMAFDPKTGRLWETENGPSCNDEINLIVKAGNFAWGPSWQCPATPSAADTNADGPAPRRLPKARFSTTIGITGAAFCANCDLGPRIGGDLLFGDVNTARIRALNMNATRTGFEGSARIVLAMPTVIYSMERGPGGRIYVSGPTGIWRLARG
jgi:glucose/arabinose dehydrogenase